MCSGAEGTTYVQHAKLPAMVYAAMKRYWQPGKAVEELELVRMFSRAREKRNEGF